MKLNEIPEAFATQRRLCPNLVGITQFTCSLQFRKSSFLRDTTVVICHSHLRLTYTQDILSCGKARELAEMDKYEFGQLLALRGVVRHYGLAELDDDLSYASSGASRR